MNLKQISKILIILFFSVQSFKNSFSQSGIKHFIFFSEGRENIHDSAFFSNPGVTGAQITYPWKRLETQKGNYDLSEIGEDFLISSPYIVGSKNLAI